MEKVFEFYFGFLYQEMFLQTYNEVNVCHILNEMGVFKN